ncbi:tRNA lysidine(34) synthetase TilS [Corynebacterium glyciniphilum]|uniref:tRNA lysidine(34) synthetase TilS n=1 Tax=Corynebacterium glyciniphilum TaxID=1404244 RepID=UPI003FD049BB
MIDTPHTLEVRRSLGRFLSAHAPRLSRGDAVVCGVSGGGDSLALVAACVHAGLDVTTVTVDHGLQDGSAQVARDAARTCRVLGATARTVRVQVAGSGEADARDARYRALGECADGRPVLVAHTADDDAEGLLLALARGSGTGSLAGLREVTDDHPVVTAGAGWLGRPLLHATRADTLGSCAELELDVWNDPHNSSATILRSRVRNELLPLAREILGEHVGDALARSARLLREDADLLDDQARRVLSDVGGAAPATLPVGAVAGRPAPLRRRVLRQWLGARVGPLTSRHLEALDALIADWHGQGAVAVPYPATGSPSALSQTSTMGGTRRLVVRRRRTATGSQLVLEQEDRTP